MNDTQQLQTGDDLALDALSEASQNTPALPANDTPMSEAEESDKLAETLTALQNVIEKNAIELEKTKTELKEKRQELKNVFDNDISLVEAKEEADKHKEQVRERQAKLQADPQVTSLKIEIKEVNQRKKEIEEALSNHLINYNKMTDSTSFDTSDGDQWEFSLKAKVKGKPKS
jgi:chromosome segregation ATPase